MIDFRGPSFIDFVDSLPPISRAMEAPARVIIVDKYGVGYSYLYT